MTIGIVQTGKGGEVGMSETNVFEELIVMRSKRGDGTIYRQRPLVRCKDCKNRNTLYCFKDEQGFGTDEDWFCADGERRTE